MSDLFQDIVSDSYIEQVFDVMATADWHVFQVLTKRSERMANVVHKLPSRLQQLPGVWLGVSVEDRKYGVPRIAELRRTPAAVRFLSIEPLLEDLGTLDLSDLDWVIVGGESGLGARPMEHAWVRSIRDQCQAAKVPFFFKQWGGVRKHLSGRLLDGQTYDEYPPRATTAEPPPRAERQERLRTLLARLELAFARAA